MNARACCEAMKYFASFFVIAVAHEKIVATGSGRKKYHEALGICSIVSEQHSSCSI